MENRHLVEQFMAGDLLAASLLFARYRARAVRYARTILKDEQAAEDAVQDAMVAAYERIRRLRDAVAFRSWFLAFVRKRCTDKLSEKQPVGLEDVGELSSGQDLEQALVNQMAAAQLSAALAGLAPGQADLLVMHYVLRLSLREIAARLSVSEDTAKSRVHRARSRFKKLVSALGLLTKSRAKPRAKRKPA